MLIYFTLFVLYAGPRNAIFTGGINKLNFTYFGEMVNVSLDQRGTKWSSTVSYRHQDGCFPTSRLGHTVNNYDGRLVLFGGRERMYPDGSCASTMLFADKTEHTAFSYDLECGSWSELLIQGAGAGRVYHTTTHLNNNEFIVMGGLALKTPHESNHDMPMYHWQLNASGITSRELRCDARLMNLASHSTLLLDSGNLLVCGGFIPGHKSRSIANQQCYIVAPDGSILQNFASPFSGPCSMLCLDGDIVVYDKKTSTIWQTSVADATDTQSPERVQQELPPPPQQPQTPPSPQPGPSQSPMSASPQPSPSQSPSPQPSPSPSSSASPSSSLNVPSSLFPVVGGGSCGIGQDCHGDGKMMQCDKCDLFFHFACQGFSSSPFEDDDEQLDSQYFCIVCRDTFRPRKATLLHNTNGIIFSRK